MAKQSQRPVGDEHITNALTTARTNIENVYMFLDRADDALLKAVQQHNENQTKGALLYIAEYHAQIEHAKELL